MMTRQTNFYKTNVHEKHEKVIDDDRVAWMKQCVIRAFAPHFPDTTCASSRLLALLFFVSFVFFVDCSFYEAGH